jgi:type I restriction enzyme R subunit
MASRVQSEHKKWLAFIREHLIRNMTIALQDFAICPIFERQGGLSKAKQVFAGQLETLIAEINYLIAA